MQHNCILSMQIIKNGFSRFVKNNTTTITKSLIPNKLGSARNEIQSEIIEIKDLEY
jgi:hypothetical protein